MANRMSRDSIRELLLAKGEELFQEPPERVRFTGDAAADDFLNNLSQTPHAFVLGCIVDRQIPAERAWMIPYRLAEAIGDQSFRSFRSLSFAQIKQLMTYPRPLHRFPDQMARNVHEGIGLIAGRYGGVASRIWTGRVSSAEVVSRFLEFRGVGQKIATMAANILARHFKVPFSDYFSVDISADVHVRRVFARLGLVPEKATTDQIVSSARVLSPTFPGLLDFPCFTIGRNWCRPTAPLCHECYMGEVCPTGLGSGLASKPQSLGMQIHEPLKSVTIRNGVSTMRYMINVDLETSNLAGSGTDCQSALHEPLGRHFDLTVHKLSCGCRGPRAVERPPVRHWLDDGGDGYTAEAVLEKVLEIQAGNRSAYPRRCRVCDVEANLPHWD